MVLSPSYINSQSLWSITAKHQAKAMEPEINMNDNCAYERPPERPSGISMEANSAYGVFEIL